MRLYALFCDVRDCVHLYALRSHLHCYTIVFVAFNYPAEWLGHWQCDRRASCKIYFTSYVDLVAPS